MKKLKLLRRLEQHECWLSASSSNLIINGQVSSLPGALITELKKNREKWLSELGSLANLPVMRKKDPVTVFLSSRGQRRLAYLSKLYPDSPSYNVAASLYFKGPLDVSRLETTLTRVILRHESAFTYLAYSEGDDISVIDKSIPISLPFEYLEGKQDADIRAQAIRKEIATTAFDLSKPPLWRMKLLRHRENYHELVVSIHHYISDGWSLVNTLRDMAHIYNGGNEQTLIKAEGFKSFARYEREREIQGYYKKAKEFWSQKLENCTPVINILKNKQRPHVLNDAGERINYSIPTQLGNKLRQIAAAHQVTIASLLNFVFSILIYHRSQSNKFALGVAYSDRPEMDMENIFGFFVNWVPVPIKIDIDESFSTLLRAFHADKVECLENGFLPFDDIVKVSQVERQPFLHPLFQYLFVSHVPARRVQFGEIELTVNPLANSRAKLDLTVFLTDARNAIPVENESNLFLEFEYNKNIFNHNDIASFIDDYAHILSEVSQSPNISLKKLANNMNNKAISPFKGTYIEPIIEIVKKDNTKIAIEFLGEKYSYNDLITMANDIAVHLTERGVEKSDCVCWCHSRSPWSIAAMIACSLIGAIFTPLDMSWPSRRRKDVINSTHPKVILCLSKNIAFVAIDNPGAIILPVDMLNPERVMDLSTSPIQLSGADPAYLLFTSGSTGFPNGVLISHDNLRSFTDWFGLYFGDCSDDRVLAKTSFVFDAFIRETIAPLQLGGTVIIVPDEDAFDGPKLAEHIARESITQLHATPSIYQAILDEAQPTQLKTLKNIMCGGEVLNESLARQHKSYLPNCRLHNVYGPTECTVDITAFEVLPAHTGKVPIGKPILGTNIYVVDEALNEVSKGKVGQLLICGQSVGLGYWNNTNLTREKFVDSPFEEGRGYLTGDYGLINENDDFEFVSRRDRQVKLQGARFELDEIERIMGSLPAIAAVAITYQSETETVVAHVTATQEVDNIKSLEKSLRDELKDLLPLYMVPGRILLKQQLPMLTSGKVDYQSLSVNTLKKIEKNKEATAVELSATEALVLEYARFLLRRKDILIEDNFFNLGGHSLSAVRFISKLNKHFNSDITLNDLFKYPNFEQLAKAIDATAGNHKNQHAQIQVKRRPRR